MNHYYNPVRIFEGPGSTDKLPDLLNSMNLTQKRVLLLVWNMDILQLPGFVYLLSPDSGFQVLPLCFQASNPTVRQLLDTYHETLSFHPEVVIAVGGGSILDVGKSLCCLYGHSLTDEDSLRGLIQSKNYGKPAARWIGIPTTAGTGSETTCWATIWDPKQDAKRSVECHQNYAWAALVDSNLTKDMPLKLAVSSGLDAAAHAIESYWAKGSNCTSRALALTAIPLVMEHMEALLDGQDQAREAMAQGSMLAGLAFSNTKTTACHSISYPLTMHYSIPHGAAVSMLLAPVLKRNLPATLEKDKLLKSLAISGPDDLNKKIRHILQRSGQPATLKEWGVQKKDLPHLASLGITKGRADNNPTIIDQHAVLEILEEIYE